MSEEDNQIAMELNDSSGGADLEGMATEAAPIEDFDQNGLLLKIAVNGITVQDYVKRLQESDILVAVDGKIYRDGPAKLREIFESRTGEEAKWLLSFWRDGQIFDILVNAPIQSQFGLATQQETDWALEQFEEHVYAEFDTYQNYEIYRDPHGVCDILSMEKDPMTFLFPVMWCLKYRLYPPLFVLLVSYGITFFSVGIQQGGESESASATSIKYKIKKLVEQEDPNSPISDDLIVSTLSKDGVSVARRTVAKYRKMENIPSSFARKRRNVLSGVV